MATTRNSVAAKSASLKSSKCAIVYLSFCLAGLSDLSHEMIFFFFFFFFFFFLCIFFLGLRFGFAQDKAKIDNWVKQFKLANPGMSQAQVDAYESPDRLDWGHPNLKNCFFCAGQCFNNPDDNTMCQVSQSNPFGNGQKRSLVNVTQVLRQPNYEARYPEIAKAHKAGIELIESMSQSHGKRNVEAMCGAAEANELTLIIPGFGRAFTAV
jgi:hypothetical protein